MGKLVNIKLGGKPFVGRRVHWYMNPDHRIDYSVVMTGKQVLSCFKRSGTHISDKEWVLDVNGAKYYSGNYFIREGRKYEVYIDPFTERVQVCRLD